MVGRARSHGAGWWSSWFVFLLLLCGTVSVLHGADVMWDLKNYHFYNPFAAYHQRYAFDVAPAQSQSYLNPLLDYPFYFAVRLFNDHPRAIAFGMGLLQGVNLWLISFLAWDLCFGQAPALRCLLTGLAVVIGGTGAGTVPLIGSTTGDVTVAIPTLASLVVLLWGAGRAGGPPVGLPRRLLIAGFLSGAAIGAKPTMACYTVGLLAALPVAVPLRSLPGALVRFSGMVAVGVLATGGYHAVRMARLFGSPLFPLFNGVLRSPFFEPAAVRDVKFLPRTLGEALYYPFGWASDASRTFVSEVPFRDIRIALDLGLIALVAVFAVLAALRGRGPRGTVPRATAALCLFVVASYAVWLPLFSVYRYLLPLEMLSGVLVMVALTYLVRAWAVPLLMAATAAGCWATTIPLEWGHIPFGDNYVEIHAPPLAADTLVLTVTDDPVSFFVPFMDPSARWLGLANSFLDPAQHNDLVSRERQVIADHHGPMVVLAPAVEDRERKRVSSVLSSFGVSADFSECGTVDANLGGTVYQLCPVRRDSP